MYSELTTWANIHMEIFIYMGLLLALMSGTIVTVKIRNAIVEKRRWREKYKNFDYNYTEANKLNKKVFGDML